MTTEHPADDSAWMVDALCRKIGGNAWFPDGHDGDTQANAQHAKETCQRCPVQTRCLLWALAGGERFGIWGGINFGITKARELNKLRAKHNIQVLGYRQNPEHHGTEAGYRRHLRANERPCRLCVIGASAARQQNRAERRQNREPV